MLVHCGTRQEIEVAYHRYRCLSCARTFSEEIPFKHPETRMTDRATSWISAFLRYGMPISTVQRITGVHWDTIKRIQKDVMDDAVATRHRELLGEGYKPRHLAVDEFAIHKGHRYATCVKNLDTGKRDPRCRPRQDHRNSPGNDSRTGRHAPFPCSSSRNRSAGTAPSCSVPCLLEEIRHGASWNHHSTIAQTRKHIKRNSQNFQEKKNPICGTQDEGLWHLMVFEL